MVLRRIAPPLLAGVLVLAVFAFISFEQNSLLKVAAIPPAPLPSIPTPTTPTPTIPTPSIDIPIASNGRITTYEYTTWQENSLRFHNFCYDVWHNELQFFTDHAKDLDMFLAKTPAARNLRMVFKFKQRATNEFAQALREHALNGTLLGPNNNSTVLLFSNDQPAHCLHDVLFSLFLDHNKPMGYPGEYYLPRASQDAKLHTCDLNKDWCCFVMHRARALRAEKMIALPKQYFERNQLVCIKTGLFPIFGRGRFAPDWSTISQVERRPFYDMTGFPLENLRALRASLLDFDDAITSNRLSIELGSGSSRQFRVNILIIDRTADRRRVWTNANEFISVLTSRWEELSPERRMGSLVYIGTQFSELSPLQQARYFHHADVIISPHGAQLSNLIFGVPGRTLAVEVTCSAQRAGQAPSATAELTWFGTFTKRLGMKFLGYSTPREDCEHNVRAFPIHAQGLVDFLKQEAVFTEPLY